MSFEELDKKYEPYTEEGFTGIEFWADDEYNNNICELLDAIISIYPDFKLSQLKLKFGMVRFYTNLPRVLETMCEEYIEEEYKLYERRLKEKLEQEGKECD